MAKFVNRHSQLSIRQQCKLLNIPRSVVYYQLCRESEEEQHLMELLDRLHMTAPAAGTRWLRWYLHRQTGINIGRKRVRLLMR